MKIEDLIKQHNKALDERVEDNPFLGQRIKARLKDHERSPARPAARKYALIYGSLLIILTVINVLIINGLKPSPTPKPPRQTIAFNTLQTNTPGHITHALQEVMK